MSDDNAERDMLESALREHVRGMSEDDFRTFVAETRPPNSAEQLKTVAGQFLSGQQLDSFVKVVDPAHFVGDSGEIDPDQVAGHLTAIFGAGASGQQQQESWGQHSGGNTPAMKPGDAGRLAAAKRFGTPAPENAAAPDSGRGAAGRAEAQRRFGTGGKQ